jgi:CRP-like cAMP-binding protein
MSKKRKMLLLPVTIAMEIEMSEHFDLDAAIQSSLNSFTKQIDQMTTEKFNEMRKCSFFDPIPSDWLTMICRDANVMTFPPGKEIITGMNSHPFYVILFGTATVYFNQKAVGTIRSGECFGESTFFPDKSINMSASVVADNEVIAVEIPGSAIRKFEGTLKNYVDKALLLALYKKLQLANLKIDLLNRKA